MQEIWKPVLGYEGLYEVSNLGNIRNMLTNKIFHIKKGCPYKKVRLKNSNGEAKNLYVHRIVAEAFIDNHDNLPQVNHIDGNKLNNNADNLEWVSSSENIRHAYSTGLNNRKNHSRISQGRKRVICVENGIIFPSITSAALFAGVTESAVCMCVKGKRKACRGYHFKYFC